MTSPLITRKQREALRRKFRPQHVRILFIGESPPASGRFFYHGDSGLYRAFRELFQTADPSICEENLLFRFRECGCYLIDLCVNPVDKLEPKARRDACAAGVSSLSRSIRQLQPEIIVSLMRSIRVCIDRATANAGWQGTILDVPYPGRWIYHRQRFITELLPHIKATMASNSTGEM